MLDSSSTTSSRNTSSSTTTGMIYDEGDGVVIRNQYDRVIREVQTRRSNTDIGGINVSTRNYPEQKTETIVQMW